MKRLVKLQSRWNRLSRVTRNIILAIVVLLVAMRLALPHALKKYVNYKLDQLPEYEGRIGDVDIHLIRGAYSIHGLDLLKKSGQVPVPFVSAAQVDFSVEWRELLHGSVVSEIQVEKAKLNFVTGPTKEQSQSGIQRGWIPVVEDLFPFKINRCEIRDSEIWFRDFHSSPKVDVYLTQLFVAATNLTNSRDAKSKLPAGVHLEATTLGDGAVTVKAGLNPLEQVPTFDVDVEIRGMNLVALNALLQAYAKVDVKQGRLDIYCEATALDGRVEGYVKPLLRDLDIVDLKEAKQPLKLFWETLVATFVNLFKNQPKDRLGTKIPFSGSFDNPDVGAVATIVNLLKNAFIKALPPRLEGTVNPEAVENKEN